ncbi:hypothetical protein BKI52_21375 [marine bacterium AO1-C]|nr:hypothetical protein BKI52_21375 [marine bacterium AO1-C]
MKNTAKIKNNWKKFALNPKAQMMIKGGAVDPSMCNSWDNCSFVYWSDKSTTGYCKCDGYIAK